MYASQLQPGRVQVNATAAVYVSWVLEQQITDGEYLVLPDHCQCGWFNPNISLPWAATVRVPDPTYNFVIGRKTFANGQVAISKVTTPSLDQRYIAQNGWEALDKATEILACGSDLPYNVRPTVNYFDESCAVWQPYLGDSTPAQIGFAAGISRVNNTAYVGRGQ
jgi:hypothetical protein